MKPEQHKQVFHAKRGEWPCVDIGREWPMNPALSMRAKGLLLICLTRYEREQITLDMLLESSIDGKASVKHGLKELRAAGHLELIPIRGRRGRIIGTRFEFHEVPIKVQQYLNAVKQAPRDRKSAPRLTERPKIGSSVNRSLGEPQTP